MSDITTNVTPIWRVTIVLFLLIIVWAGLAWLYRVFPTLRVKYPLGEPPQIFATIPYIGHLIGIFIHKNHYYTKLCQRFQLPILSLPILGGQIYILNSTKLIAAIERQPKVISFWHVEASAIGRIAGLRPEAHETVSMNVGDPDSFWLKGLRAIHHAMAPGDGINTMLLEAARTSAETLRQFDIPGGHKRVNLWDWVSHEITLSHTNAVYGPRNPYKDPQVETAFWDFSRGSWKLLSGDFSKMLAPKAYYGREKVVSAFKPYFLDPKPETTSPLMQTRMANMTDTLEIEDMARMECVNGLAILANTVPSAFWTIVQIYSQPELLLRVRGLAATAVVNTTDEPDQHPTNPARASAEKITQKKIEIIKLQRSQNHLQHIIQEVIRLRTTGIGPRLVREDVFLQNQYRLRKGSVVIIPNRALHFNRDIWGEDVDTFRDNRFDSSSSLPTTQSEHDDSNNSKSAPTNKVPTTAYRGFGGGATICPGKHFAIEGIAVFVALVVLKYDVRPAGRMGWDGLRQDTRDMALQLGSPLGKFEVDIVRREDMRNVEWVFG
ncbi:MAG: hypothetical protein Q9219_007394 [cf. Caloplaca sp. 3 TL-2023]